ncbi:MAG: hypothetical protein R3208_14120 [Ketobacteraceae bacterium]|nr:hypothetical protein [Ketobacteraceae bacterium]
MKPLHHRPVPVYVLVVPFLFFAAGCSTHSARLMQQTEQQTREQAIINRIAESLEALEQRMSKAQANEVARYAPRQLDRANAALEGARDYYQRFRMQPGNVNKSISLFFGDTMGEKALSLISEANDALTRAEAVKQRADKLFAEVNENFEWLRKFQAPTYFPYEYDDIERHHQRLIAMVADGRLDAAQDRSATLKREQRALEIAAAQRFYLDAISKRIEREDRYTLERYARLSYNRAVSALNRARHLIARDPRNEGQVIAARDYAEFAFEMAHAIAADMTRLQQMEREEMERWLIVLTNRILQVSQALGTGDLRRQPVLEQLAQLVQAAAGSQQIADRSSEPGGDKALADDDTAAAEASDGDEQDAPVTDRLSRLEKSLSEQIQALSREVATMKAAQQQVSVPLYEDDGYVPLNERKSLFNYR